MVDRHAPVAPLTFHVAGLLADPIGATRDLLISGVTLPLDDDLQQAGPLEGTVRLTRSNRGLLVLARLTTSLAAECVRCLTPIEVPVRVVIDEEALPSVDLATGERVIDPEGSDVVHLTDHHEIDLERSVREAISLEEPIAPVCRDDCPGLCAICGESLVGAEHDHPDDDIDPRLAALRGFVVDAGAESE